MSQALGQVSRIGGVTEAGGDEILDGIFAHILARRGHILNIHQVVAHSPKMLRAQAAYASAMRDDSLIPRDLQEVIILRVAQVNQSEYEQTVHRPIALACGVSVLQIAELSGWRESAAFDRKQKAVLSLVDQAAAGGEVDDDVMQAVLEHFSFQEVVEIVVIVGWYVGNSRFVRALRIAPQPEAANPT